MRLRRKKTYLMDENVKIAETEKIKNCNIINSTERFTKGTKDEVLTRKAKQKKWIIVTKDIRMALRSLIDGVEVVFINDEYQTIEFITANKHKRNKYKEMFDYLNKRFNYGSEITKS